MISAQHVASPVAWSCRIAGAVPVPRTGADLLPTAIATLLARRAGETPDAKEIAAAVADTWPQVTARLAPVIGVRGVTVLLRRAVHLTSTTFPWLQVPENEQEGAVLLQTLTTRLAEQRASTAVEASRALLVTFTELLTTLIGESLTERLLSPVWAPPPTVPQQESEK